MGISLCSVASRTRLAACALVWAAPLHSAFAQGASEQHAPPAISPDAPPPPMDEEKIDQFADAYVVIEEIHQRAMLDLDQVHDPEEANEVKARAEAQMIRAVERSGLELAEFNRIAERMSADPELRARITSRVEERRRI
ncbi:MAG TPA: DUF4168 domain-containing protein [Steroidobacter sp.]|nr:DUF4168 domain-containing protein [Steroidobacter sp.]